MRYSEVFAELLRIRRIEPHFRKCCKRILGHASAAFWVMRLPHLGHASAAFGSRRRGSVIKVVTGFSGGLDAPTDVGASAKPL